MLIKETMIENFNYGGGVQSVAVTVLIAQGKLPNPDYIVIADTGRERLTTWDYLDRHTRPLLAQVGLEVQREIVQNLEARGYQVVEGIKGRTNAKGKTFLKPGQLLDLTVYGPYPQCWIFEVKRPRLWGKPLSQIFGLGQQETIESLRARGWSCWVVFDWEGVKGVMAQ